MPPTSRVRTAWIGRQCSIYSPGTFPREIHKAFSLRAIGYVRGYPGNVGAGFLMNLLGRFGGVRFIPRTKKHSRAFTRQLTRGGKADTATGRGNQSHAIF